MALKPYSPFSFATPVWGKRTGDCQFQGSANRSPSLQISQKGIGMAFPFPVQSGYGRYTSVSFPHLSPKQIHDTLIMNAKVICFLRISTQVSSGEAELWRFFYIFANCLS